MEAHPPPVQMVQMLAGFQLSQALYVAAKLGLADAMVDREVPVGELATTVDADPAALARLLRALCSVGVFSETAPDTFGLTPLGSTLVSDQPGSMRDLALMWMETHYAPFAELLGTVRTGESAATIHYGRPFFEWLAGQPEQIGRFSRAMANLTGGIKALAIASYDFSGAGTIVDLGAADGAVLAAILSSTSGLSGIAFDLPHVVSDAEQTIAAYGLGDRLTTQAGSFFDAVPGGADTYLLSMVLHDWDDEDATKLLCNIGTAAKAGARIRALELVVPAGNEPHMSKMIDLTMLAMLKGRERSDTEMRALFEGAGLVYDGVVDTPTPISVVEAHVR